MYIKEIFIKSFRHLKNLRLGPFDQPSERSDLIVLAGPNAGGKSSILELLGYALSNTWTLSWKLGRSFPAYSFEVAISVSPEERELIQSHQASTDVKLVDDDILKYFKTSGIYYRAFNYDDGNYQKNITQYNKIHNIVTSVLRNHYSHSLGFFLKSDRTYRSQNFRRDRIFEFPQMNKRDYIWDKAFQSSEIQYQDMFEFLVQQRYHYFRKLGTYHHRINSGIHDGSPPPTDPLKQYDELMQGLFPGYKFDDSGEEIPSNLFVQLPLGDVVPFADLSSGEKEVFFILSFFLRHDVTNSVIVIDEPELHLHPEFARLLVRTMQSIKPGNQLWAATHNTEIIDEAGRDRVIYLARDPKTYKATVTLGTDETGAMRQLKNLFGYSGYIGIAKNMVFLEGLDSSSDRKMFSNLFPEFGSNIKFIPSKSSENLARINTAVLSIMESNLGWIQFYLIRDRDFLTEEAIKKYVKHSSGRMYVLDRYHIENYLLDEDIIAEVEADIYGNSTTPEQVINTLRSIARAVSGEVLRDMVEFRLNLIYSPQDFSLGKFLDGQVVFDPEGNWNVEKVSDLKERVLEKTKSVENHLASHASPDAIEDLISKGQEQIRKAITGKNDGWRSLFPGRLLLEKYAKKKDLGNPLVLQNSLIKALSSKPSKVPEELQKIMQIISEGKKFEPPL